MARPDERRFVTFPRGHVRDRIILDHFRAALRDQLNPDTGDLFTEDEIAQITQPGSRYHREADGIDLYGQATQSRALFFVDQSDPRRAATPFLREHWGRLWGLSPLGESSGSGSVFAVAPEGTVWRGSTVLGAPNVHVARDAAGNRYQVLFTETTPGLGNAAHLELMAIDGGAGTNPEADAILTWETRPAGAAPECTVDSGFAGGFDAETNQEFANRIGDSIRHRPANGNPAHFRAWASQSSVAVESAFVYPCAFHAGSVLVCVLMKRGATVGPLARIANVGLMLDATAFLVPPGSPVVPQRAHVLVTTAKPQSTDVALSLALEKGTSGGWTDTHPWPTVASSMSTVASQTEFTIAGTPGTLPGGATSLSGDDAPSIMVWDDATSRFEQLSVTSVVEAPAGTYTVTLSTEPDKTIAVGDRVSPHTELHETIAETAESYFDELGPGELFDATDVRAERAFRFPRPGRRWSARVGQQIVSRLEDSLGTALIDGSVSYADEIGNVVSEPDLPAQLTDGPNLLVLGKLALVEL